MAILKQSSDLYYSGKGILSIHCPNHKRVPLRAWYKQAKMMMSHPTKKVNNNLLSSNLDLNISAFF